MIKQIATYSFIILLTFLKLAFPEKIDNAIIDAENFYKEQTIVNLSARIKPEDLIGSLIYYKPDKPDDWEYISVVPQSILGEIEPVNNNKIIFQSMVSQKTVIDAKYLIIFKGKITKENLLQVILEDLFDLKAPSFLNNNEIKRLVFENARALKDSGYIVEYVDRVNVTLLTARIFEKGDRAAGFNFYVEADATNFKSTSEFQEKTLISVHRNNVIIFIPKGNNPNMTGRVELIPSSGLNKIPNIKKGKFSINPQM